MILHFIWYSPPCGKKFATDKGVLDKIGKNGDSECFITLKDHKPNYANNPKFRLINTSKP